MLYATPEGGRLGDLVKHGNKAPPFLRYLTTCSPYHVYTWTSFFSSSPSRSLFSAPLVITSDNPSAGQSFPLPALWNTPHPPSSKFGPCCVCTEKAYWRPGPYVISLRPPARAPVLGSPPARVSAGLRRTFACLHHIPLNSIRPTPDGEQRLPALGASYSTILSRRALGQYTA